jgi:predicted acylesterase/phospholipase RssA
MSDLLNLSPAKKCDIVMKGGITSGIVYPRAVTRLAKEYSFQSIGGTSAGAIAAAITAAAEYQRRNGTDVFAEMDKIPGWLGAPAASGSGSNLFHLFQPQKSMSGLYRVAAAFLGYSGWKLFVRLVGALGLDALLGALPGLAVIVLLWSNRPLSGSLLGVLIAAVGLVLGAFAGVALRAARLPQNRFGLCTGYVPPKTGAPVSLTEWLNNQINTIAGHSAEQPLTFGDLKKAGVTLKMISTCLTLGRPYTMPFEKNEFYFSPDEMRLYFPEKVVDWMVKHPGKVSDSAKLLDTQGLVRFPDEEDLPVIVPTRFSLSFPILFCAVPLYLVDWTRRQREAGDPVPSPRVPGDAIGHDELRRPELVWFSDGGICSNFPLHLFDSALPRWPTFGLNLRETRADRSYTNSQDHVWMPTKNVSGIIPQEWKRWGNSFTAGFTFVGSIVDAARNWTDTLQTMVPGYRDRIAHIYLSPEQGGLNLNMPTPTVAEISEYGSVAATLLADRYLRGIQDGLPTPMTWDNQRWIRYRSVMELLGEFLSKFRRSFQNPEPGDRSYAELIERDDQTPPASYRFSEEQRECARDISPTLADLGQELEDSYLADGAPRPEPSLRVRPTF